MSHLELANQTYEEHFYDSMGYCLMAMEAGIYFFIHALFPDVFTSAGSQTIKKLYDKIEHKLNSMLIMSDPCDITMILASDTAPPLSANGTAPRAPATEKGIQR